MEGGVDDRPREKVWSVNQASECPRTWIKVTLLKKKGFLGNEERPRGTRRIILVWNAKRRG